MRLQNFAIIFLIIAIPLILILSYYLNLQKETLELQAEYDVKLAEATKEAIKAYEVNTVEWSSELGITKTYATKRNEVKAMLNTFMTSMANNLNISGTAKETLANYIPAAIMTTYDGYYTYMPEYTAIPIENDEGLQLYYDTTSKVITDSYTSGDKIIYEPASGASVISTQYTYTNNNGTQRTETIEFVTEDNFDDAKKEYRHILSNKNGYVERFKTSNIDVIVNYTLDNRITIQGTIDNKEVKKDGYLIYFDSGWLPYSEFDDDDEDEIWFNLNSTLFREEHINPELLEEQVLYYESNQYILGSFNYVYDIQHIKYYYDNVEKNFFTVNSNTKEREFLSDAKIGDADCVYKSVSVLSGDFSSSDKDNITEYKKVYQVLSPGRDKGQWVISLDPQNAGTSTQKEVVDTKIKELNYFKNNLAAAGLDKEIYYDYSAISYYVESFAFTNWVRNNLGDIEVEVEGVKTKIFDISSTNDPEEKYSPIAIHKKEVIKNSIISSLNSAIANYGNGTQDYQIPKISESDWDQVFNNVSLITFFQGVSIGLKKYNNYAIATSTTNREYVNPEEIYFSGTQDEYYHRFGCVQSVFTNSIGGAIKREYTGYRSTEYTLRTYKYTKSDGTTNQIYYYEHDNPSNTDSEKACYSCIIDSGSYTKYTKDTAANSTYLQKYEKSYYTALARERYYQKKEIDGKMGITLTYDANMKVEGIITDVTGVLQATNGTQEINLGGATTITSEIPSVTTNNSNFEYIFKGWALSKTASTPDYTAGDYAYFTDDTTLYAVWSLKLSKLKWKTDFKTNISNITIDEYNNVKMVGNGNLPGKGVAWIEWEYTEIDLFSMSFNYKIDFGDSFTAAGILLGITDSEPNDEHSGILSGYMISFNNNGAWGTVKCEDFFKEATNNNLVTLWHFQYEKGKCGDHKFTELTKEDAFSNIPTSGSMEIKITQGGYSVKANNGQEITISCVTSVNKNSIGFFSNHYSHGCSNIGHFNIENVSIITSTK